MKKILKGKKARNSRYYSDFYDRYFEVCINDKKITILEGKDHFETFLLVRCFNTKKLKKYKGVDIQPVMKNGKISIRTVSDNLKTTVKTLKRIDKLFEIIKDDIQGLEIMATETYNTGYELVS